MQWEAKKKIEGDGWKRHFAILPILIDDTWHWLERVEYQFLVNEFGRNFRSGRGISKAGTEKEGHEGPSR